MGTYDYGLGSNYATELAGGAGGTPLDPRGLLFLPDGQTLLVANADPEIDALTPNDFIAADLLLDVPEPSGLAVLATAAAFAAAARRRVRGC